MYNLYYQDMLTSTPPIDFAGIEFLEFLRFLDSFLFLGLLCFIDLVVFLVFGIYVFQLFLDSSNFLPSFWLPLG